jgi:hypothetical protein
MDWKAVLKSRTVWLNVIGGTLEFLSLTELLPVLPMGAMPYIVLVHAGGNILLRRLGGAPLTKQS